MSDTEKNDARKDGDKDQVLQDIHNTRRSILNLIKKKRSISSIKDFLSETEMNYQNGNIEIIFKKESEKNLREVDKSFPFKAFIDAIQKGKLSAVSNENFSLLTVPGSKDYGNIGFIYSKEKKKWEIISLLFNVD
ncbi:MAG TPA: hypothetical protein PL088_05660 [Spirochaetota bacterium]|nr:hypothetical protein [Spirochaetota bacterium]